MHLDLLPKPKTIEVFEKAFQLDIDSKIFIESSILHNLIETTNFFGELYTKLTLLDINIKPRDQSRFKGIHLIQEDHEEEVYRMEVNESGIHIYANEEKGFHNGLMTLIQIIKESGLSVPYLYIEDEPHFKHRGFYYDVTRGKVPKKETLFNMIDLLSEYKVNELQLYIEHTFLWENLSEAFRDKDALSAQDIIEIDEYAHKRHVELIPSIATFGHMYEILESKSYRHLSEKPVDDNIPFSFVNRMVHHTINVDKEESIKLISSMIDSFIPLFKSHKFNICGDETFDLGHYNTSKLAEEKGIGRLYVDFLKQVMDIVRSKGKQVLFWGDIILKYPEMLDELPGDVICLNWGYFANEDESNTKTIRESGVPQYVCSSTTGWNRMINWLDNSSENIRTMTKHAVNHNAYGILITDWGDYGHVNLWSSSIPMIIYGAGLAWNPDGMANDDIDDKIISKSYYGQKNEDLLNLIRRISRNQIGNWSFINFILEQDYANQELIASYIPIMQELDHVEIYKSVNTLNQLIPELLSYGKNLDYNIKTDFYELIVMSKLMQLTQESFLYLMHYELDVEDVKFTRCSEAIAVDLEYAVEDYKKAWRMRNRESELTRVTNAFYRLADKLRDYSKISK